MQINSCLRPCSRNIATQLGMAQHRIQKVTQKVVETPNKNMVLRCSKLQSQHCYCDYYRTYVTTTRLSPRRGLTPSPSPKPGWDQWWPLAAAQGPLWPRPRVAPTGDGNWITWCFTSVLEVDVPWILIILLNSTKIVLLAKHFCPETGRKKQKTSDRFCRLAKLLAGGQQLLGGLLHPKKWS